MRAAALFEINQSFIPTGAPAAHVCTAIQGEAELVAAEEPVHEIAVIAAGDPGEGVRLQAAQGDQQVKAQFHRTQALAVSDMDLHTFI